MTELTLSRALARKREPRRASFFVYHLPRASTRVLPLSFSCPCAQRPAPATTLVVGASWTFAFGSYDTALRISQSQLYARPSVPFFVSILSFSLAELLRFKKLLSRLSLACLTTEEKRKRKRKRLSLDPLFFILLLTSLLTSHVREFAFDDDISLSRPCEITMVYFWRSSGHVLLLARSI